jgi:hypothetical protein
VVHEVDRACGDYHQLIQAARKAIAGELEVGVSVIVLIEEASMLKTSSGKTARNACRDAFLCGDLRVVAQWRDAKAALTRDAALAGYRRRGRL